MDVATKPTAIKRNIQYDMPRATSGLTKAANAIGSMITPPIINTSTTGRNRQSRQ